MDGTGNLILDFLDVYGDRPDDRVDVLLKHQVLSQSVHVTDQATTKRLRITDLDSTQGGIFNLQVFPMRRRPVSRFVRVPEDKTTQQSIVLPVDASRVTGIDAPPFDSLGDDLKAVLGTSSVEGLEDKRGAALVLQPLYTRSAQNCLQGVAERMQRRAIASMY